MDSDADTTEQPEQNITSNPDKLNTADAIPSSSTDANLTVSNVELSEDLITSTSSEINLQKKDEPQRVSGEQTIKSSSEEVSSLRDDKALTEEDFLNFGGGQSEKITEDVEDIVQDLENLLGESSVLEFSANKHSAEACMKTYTSSENIGKSNDADKIDDNVELACESTSSPIAGISELPNSRVDTQDTPIDDCTVTLQQVDVLESQNQIDEATPDSDGVTTETPVIESINSEKSEVEEEEAVTSICPEITSETTIEATSSAKDDIGVIVSDKEESDNTQVESINLDLVEEQVPTVAVVESQLLKNALLKDTFISSEACKLTNEDLPSVEDLKGTRKQEEESNAGVSTEISIPQIPENEPDQTIPVIEPDPDLTVAALPSLEDLPPLDQITALPPLEASELPSLDSDELPSLDEIVVLPSELPSAALPSIEEIVVLPSELPSATLPSIDEIAVSASELATAALPPIDEVAISPSELPTAALPSIEEIAVSPSMQTVEAAPSVEGEVLDLNVMLPSIDTEAAMEAMDTDCALPEIPLNESCEMEVDSEATSKAEHEPQQHEIEKSLTVVGDRSVCETSEEEIQPESSTKESTIAEIVESTKDVTPTISQPEVPESSEVISDQEKETYGFKIVNTYSLEEDAAVKAHVQSEITTVLEQNDDALIEQPESSKRFQQKTNQSLMVNVDEVEHVSEKKSPFKITITKHADSTHSILKIYNPEEGSHPASYDTEVVSKSVKKSARQQIEQKLSPRTKQSYSSVQSGSSQGIPKVTIKPVTRELSPLKITIKPVLKPDENVSKVSPKLTIKPIIKPETEEKPAKLLSPKLTIKPIPKPDDRITIEPSKSAHKEEQRQMPKLTIKSFAKMSEEEEQPKCSPKLTIKPIKPDDSHEEQKVPKLTIRPIQSDEVHQQGMSSPKITIKPIVNPEEQQPSPKIIIKPVVRPEVIDVDTYTISSESDTRGVSPEEVDYEDEIRQERIILKINKSTLPSRKREHSDENDKSEKLAKIKVKYSKEGGHAHIIPQRIETATHGEGIVLRKRTRTENTGATTSGSQQESKLKEMLSCFSQNPPNVVCEDTLQSEPINIIHATSEEADPISNIPVFEISPDTVPPAHPAPPPQQVPVAAAPPPVMPRKRGRPRKVPLEVREDFKDPPKEEEPVKEQEPSFTSTRPKRSCRGQSIRATLGIKPRKPRGPGRGRGGKRGMEAKVVAIKPAKEPKFSTPRHQRLLKESPIDLTDETDSKDEEYKDDGQSSLISDCINPLIQDEVARDVPIYEEETRMSADIRTQLPSKQVTVEVEESQSSFQSTATTESGKVRKGPRLEVHQEPEGAVISAEQLAEYSWGGGGPYMLQEQVAQFLGIKSFKRKYPGIQRRPVDMQERDFIRESGLASEAMCDLGLTAVSSADILDIMYSDFQPKYEEYCKHQRDRQAKDLTNKQKALTLAASQEKNKLDITEQAVQSAAAWNASFNKARREERKACMDLQTFTVHYPKNKMKQINKPPVGNYPVSLVPGQFTDYYKTYTPTEINNLPLNTMLYNEVNANYQNDIEDSQSDGSVSDSETSSSDSESSDSGSSDNCAVCSSGGSQKRVSAY